MKKTKKRMPFVKAASVLLTAAVCLAPGMTMKALSVHAAETAADTYQLAESCQEGTILHCFNWPYSLVAESMSRIAAAGFTSVQLSPAQVSFYNRYEGHSSWYYAYQTFGMEIELYEEEILRDLCSEADKYGVKVIMDVVANHSVYAEQPSDWRNLGTITDYSSRTNITTGDLLGLKDLDTENKAIQNKVKSYLDKLYEAGVDGIRWDAAKHIGLPSEGSDFWPTVLDERLYHYGEILNGPVDTDEKVELMKEYASLMSVTDNTYGAELVKSFDQGKAPDAESEWLSEGISADRLVFWGESHDTYSNGPYEKGATTRMSQNTIDKAYAVAAAREGATSLYLSRPSETESEKILFNTKGSVHFTSPEVSAVNHFHNAMAGKKDCVLTENNCVVISRENGGAVIVCGGEGGQVSVSNPGGYAVPGTYFDEVSGSLFTVTESSITGTVGESGIAVIYDSDFLGQLTADSNEVYSFFGSLDITLGAQNVQDPAYELTYTDENGTNCIKSESFSDGDRITIGEGVKDDTDITLTLTGTAPNGKTRKEVFSYNISRYNREYPYGIEEMWSDCIILFDNVDTGWEEVYCYAYSKDGGTLTENAPYPGEKMTDEGQEFYSCRMSEAFNGKEFFVIFNNGKGVQISEGKNLVNKTTYPYGAWYSDDYWLDSRSSEPILPTGHNHTLVFHEAVSPTQTDPGTLAYYSCIGCEKLYADPAGLQEVTLEELAIPASGRKDPEDGKPDKARTEEIGPAAHSDKNIPETGDTTVYAAISLAAASALAVIVILGRRKTSY